jgi:hypothetical protein
LAALELLKGLSFIEAEALAHKVLAWVGQTYNKWLWDKGLLYIKPSSSRGLIIVV